MRSTEVEQGRAALRVLIAGGGTGGHVVPALAIARELRDRHAADVRFVGTARGLETRLVPEAGFPLELVRSGQLKNVSFATRLKTALDLPMGVLECVRLIREFRPQVVIGVGGYASGPGMMAALLLRVPTLAFEPNAVPGLANRLVGKRVSAAAVNFQQTRPYFRDAVVTGIPVRPEFFSAQPREQGVKGQTLLVFGGSLGARVLNEVMPRIASALLQRFPELQIVHQTGGRHAESTSAAYETSGVPMNARVQVRAYLDDMPAQFARADLILCRSGASTVAELGAAGKPSILVPFAQAADDHQRKNAEVFRAAGAAKLITEAELNPERLLDEISGLLSAPAVLHQMGERARGLAHPDALSSIAGIVVGLAKGR